MTAELVRLNHATLLGIIATSHPPRPALSSWAGLSTSSARWQRPAQELGQGGKARACELLSWALTSNGANGPAEHAFGNGLLAALVDLARLGDVEGFAAEVGTYMSFMGAFAPAAGAERVMIPSDPKRTSRHARLAHGLPVLEPALGANLAVAMGHGLDASREEPGLKAPPAGTAR